MADNINFRMNNFDRFSNGFSLPSTVIMPKNTNKPEVKNDVYTPTKETQTNAPAIPPMPEAETTKTDNPTNKTDNSQKVPVKNPQQEPKSETKPESKEKKPLGKIMFYSMLVAAAAVLVLTKGLSGSTAEKIKIWTDKWENKFLLKASKNRVVGAINRTLTSTAQKAKRLFALSEAAANITAIKDNSVRKLTSIFKPVKRFCDFVTRNVLKITYSAVDSKYRTANTGLDRLEARFRNALAHSNATPEQVSKCNSLLDRIFPTFRKGFSQNARNSRLAEVHEGLKGLADEVSSKLGEPFRNKEHHGFFNKIKAFFGKTKRNYSSYVTLNTAEPTHIKHRQAVDTAKRILSNEVSDVSVKLQRIANDLKHCFDAGDIESQLKFGELLEKLNIYKGLSGSKEGKLRETIQKEILSTLSQIKDKVAGFSYTDKKGNLIKYGQQETEKITQLISSMKETMTNTSQKGLLQEILTEFKPILPEKEYKSLKAGVGHVNNLLNDAVEAEGNNMFNKIAESKLGSIITDMGGLAFLGGTGIVAVSKGKDKDEKVGATLKVGIPMIGTIGAYFYSAARAFSGTTNLLFSAATGFILNRIGDSIYNYYQKRFVENKTVKEIVQDTYDNVTQT